jgi:hypothetical protein
LLLALLLAVGPGAAHVRCAPDARVADGAEAGHPRPRLEGGPETERRVWQLLLPAGGFLVALGLSALVSPVARFFIRLTATTNRAALARNDPWLRSHLEQRQAGRGTPGPANDGPTKT